MLLVAIDVVVAVAIAVVSAAGGMSELLEKIDQLEDKVKSIENKIDEVLTTLKKGL